MNDRGYINMVVLEESPRAKLFQQKWHAMAEAYAGQGEFDQSGECHDWEAPLAGTDHLLPAVWGCAWEATDLEDTLNAMAAEILNDFPGSPPPFLATCHYDNSEQVYAAAYWSGDARDQDWWHDPLQGAPPPFDHEAPDFFLAQLEIAIEAELPAAMAFRSSVRQKVLEETLPSTPTPSPRTPRF